MYLNPSDPLIIDETCGFFFGGGGVSSTFSYQERSKRLGLVTAPRLLGNNLTSRSQTMTRWKGEKEGRDGWSEKEKRAGGAGVGGDDQFSTPVSIMSSPVRTDLRIKLLRDLPELRCNQ